MNTPGIGSVKSIKYIQYVRSTAHTSDWTEQPIMLEPNWSSDCAITRNNQYKVTLEYFSFLTYCARIIIQNSQVRGKSLPKNIKLNPTRPFYPIP